MLDSAVSTQEQMFVAPESTAIQERIVVAPCAGRFVPLPPEEFHSEGEWIEEGQGLAEVVSGSRRTPVRSPFRGWVMGMLALPGQPVHQGEALFWVSSR
jgi:biotin carboxyl carrier protein